MGSESLVAGRLCFTCPARGCGTAAEVSGVVSAQLRLDCQLHCVSGDAVMAVTLPNLHYETYGYLGYKL